MDRNILVSSCKSSVELILTQPLAMRREEFWIVSFFLNKGWIGVREPNGSYMHENGPGKGHIDDKYGFLLVTPVDTGKGIEDVDTE